MVNGTVSAFLEYVWMPFVGLFWWFINRLTGQLDEIDKKKADIGAIKRLDGDLGELEKKLGKIDHSTQLRLVPRSEYKSDITALHQRINSLERGKEDKIKEMKIIKDKDK